MLNFKNTKQQRRLLLVSEPTSFDQQVFSFYYFCAMGYGSTKKKGITKYKLITFSAIVMLIWLLLSSLANRSPIRTISSIGQLFSKDPDPVLNYSRDELIAEVRKRDVSIDSLELLIESFSVIKKMIKPWSKLIQMSLM